MTAWTLIVRSLRFYARAHAGVLFGAVIGSGVLCGALLVGDSVRWSLTQFALARLGKLELALAANDRFFTSRLADHLQATLPGPVAPGLLLFGTASRSDGAARANHVQVLGLEEHFWQLSPQPPPTLNFPPNAVLLNDRLAAQLNARAGDTILLRVPKPGALPRDAPISPQEEASTALRLTVQGIVNDAQMGRFSLQANQVGPFNAFVSLGRLQNELAVSNRANLLLVGGTGQTAVRLETAMTRLQAQWQLADAQLELRALPAVGALELRSGRVFLEAHVARAALQLTTNASGILTYFVNEIRHGQSRTPYSIVAAMGRPVVSRDMADDEILINQWLANDLQAKPGDVLDLRYYVVGTMRTLEERQQSFRVRAIVPLQGVAADRELMPDYPGLAKAENCRDWDAGFPIKLDWIRPKDEQYWHEHRGTPKAFLTLAAGQRMWANRFGDLTAIRYPLASTSSNQLAQLLRQRLDPSGLGLRFEPVRAQAMKASAESQDFGQLFLGFSFFLIVAALMLMALLFQFGLEQRTTEVGTLLALGFRPRRVRWFLLGEAGVLALLGGLLGALGGTGYAQAMLYGLSTLWRGAVGTSALHYHAEPMTLVVGAGAGAGIAWLTIWLALRNLARRSAHELLALGAEWEPSTPGRGPRRGGAKIIAAAAGLGGLLILGYGLRQSAAAAGAFFGAGALWLVSGIFLASLLLSSLNSAAAETRLSLKSLSLRNATRRRKRSLATVALLACGSFLIVAVGANRLDAVRDADKRASGTGGFALIGESTLPVVHDMNSAAGRDFFGLDAKAVAGVQWVQLRVHEGDDASCLNLNRVQQPRLLGVRPELLQGRGAFTFAEVAKGLPEVKGWLLLHRAGPDEAVPAIGDEASIVWALGKKVGDLLAYTDEQGRRFQVRLVGALANSILQGSLLIDEKEFVARFPSESGYHFFLLDAPPGHAAAAAALSRAMQDVGLELTPATRRLAAFNAVQNTYLSTFQVLGGLGLVLGSLGLGVVVLRNVLERRGELALMVAVGFRSRALAWLIVCEHGALLGLGLGIGLVAAVIAVLPALLSPGAEVPYCSLALTLGAILLSGAVWTWLATRLALRGNLLAALRNE